MFNSAVPSVADIAAVTDGNNRYGGYGFGEGWWAIVIILALFGGFGRGGLWGNGGGSGCDGACATVGDIERGFNNQSTQQRFNGIDQGLCQLGYDNLAQITSLQNTVMQGNFALQQAINNASVANMQDTNSISRQLADCCCETREAIQGVNFNMSQGFANQSFQLQQCCCDLQNTMNANTQTIINQLNAYRMEDKNETIAQLRSEVQQLNLAASQTAQNAFIAANQEAQTAEILRRTGHDCPTAAYIVQPPTPVTFATNSCGNAYAFAGNNCCC